MSEEEINNTKDSCVAILRRKGQFVPNIQDLSKDNWKNHIKCIQEGVNPTKITIALRNDDLEMLQDITSQNNFNFNQKIEPSLYEMCSFVNNVGVSLIDYSAFFGSVKCFKFLLLNGSNSLNTGRFAVAGGNLEIIHLCEQNSSSFSKSYEAAIEFHHNNIFYYLYDNKIININNNELNELGIKCIQCNNFEILSFLEEIGMKINNSLINESARNGNIYLVKHFIEIGQIPKDILIDSVNSGNIELIKYILSQKELISMQKCFINVFNICF